MVQFRYRAAPVAAGAEPVEGRMEAPSKAAVVDRLHALGQVPIRIEELGGTRRLGGLAARDFLQSSSRSSGRRRMSMRSLVLLTGQIATLLQAGLAIDESLRIAEELVEGKAEKSSLRALSDKVSGGATLADAMAAQGRVFPPFYVSMVRAGEAGASLDGTLARLAEYLDRTQAAREHVKSALIYPLIVAATCCVSIATLFLFVVPRFRPMFEQAGDALPGPARAIMAVSDALQDYWWLLFVLPLVAVLLVRWQLGDPERRFRWERRLLRIPLIGPIVTKVEVARFSRTLGTLLRNGVSLLAALTITQQTIGNRVFHDALSAVIERVKAGKGLAEPMMQAKVFPALAVHLVRVGEESGRQDEMLLKLADIFEVETRRSVDRMLALLSPALTVVLGVIVAGVIGSILSAVLSVYDLAM